MDIPRQKFTCLQSGKYDILLRWFATEPEGKSFYSFPGARPKLGWAVIKSEGATVSLGHQGYPCGGMAEIRIEDCKKDQNANRSIL